MTIPHPPASRPIILAAIAVQICDRLVAYALQHGRTGRHRLYWQWAEERNRRGWQLSVPAPPGWADPATRGRWVEWSATDAPAPDVVDLDDVHLTPRELAACWKFARVLAERPELEGHEV